MILESGGPGAARDALWGVLRPPDRDVTPYADEQCSRRNAGPADQVMHRRSPAHPWEPVSYQAVVVELPPPPPAAAPPPPAEPIKQWLVAAMRAGASRQCQTCRIAARTALVCLEHAAQAVLDACRREDLFIMDRGAADEVIRDRERAAVAKAQAGDWPG